MRDLSVLITARNEEFLKRTVDDVLKKKKANTEVIVILDGSWAEPPIEEHPDVTVVYHKESVGQRAAINEAARLSKAKFIMKLDAHCIVDEGFDVKLMADCEYDWTVIPAQYNLHVFNWKCEKCGNEWYQSPTPKACQNPGEGKGKNPNCDSKKFKRVMVWEPRWNRKTVGWRFDKNLQFKYWGGLKHREGFQGDITDTMSCLGACWFLHRKRYWELGGMDEDHGSWGQMGTELACKSWFSGGRMVTNKKTWFAHMFRTQGGDFGFPYPLSGSQVSKARKHSREMFEDGKWLFNGKKPKRDLNWLLDHFSPVPDWHDSPRDLKAESGIIFYTDNQVRIKLAHAIQSNLLRASGNMPIVSISLKPMDFPYKRGKNIHVKDPRGWSTMNKQILLGLKALKTKYVFFCEHDVLYHPTHFEFTPRKNDVYYYNTNVWRLREEDGFVCRTDFCQQLSGMVCNREFAIKHYEKRQKMIDSGVQVRRIGFEPGTHNRQERVDDFKSDSYESRKPNIDVRRKECATDSKWSPDKYRNKKFAKGWTESHLFKLPGWKKEDLGFFDFK